MMRFWLLAGLIGLIFHSASAAELSASGDVVVLSGQISTGDATQFARVLSTVGHTARPVLLLNSPGGSVIEALRIGEMVRRSGIATAVVGGSVCASACSLIWVAGSARFADHTSRIGFHAAYTGEAADNRMDGAGNALIGSYLARLGLSDRAIYFATSAPPDTINWLPSDGSIVEIPYKLVEIPAADIPPQTVAAVPLEPQPVRSAAPVAAARVSLMKPNGKDYLYPHELVSADPFKRAYAGLFTGRTRPEWLVGYQDTGNGVETPVWSVALATGVLEGFRVCQPHNCNDSWMDVIFADHRAYALTWVGGKPADWWGQPDTALQLRLLNEGDPSATPPAMSIGYDAGRQARMSYEGWFNGLPEGPFKQGAQFWAANRSIKTSLDCTRQGDLTGATAWALGCKEAQKQLAPADLRRKADPDFRWGWNSL